jgi:hypothetical protein
LGSPSPPSIKFVVKKEDGTSVPWEITPSSSKTQPLLMKNEISPSYIPPSPKIHIIKTPVVHVKTQYPPCYHRIYNTMVGRNLPRNRMDAIVAARYAPLVLPQPMNSLPVGDYLKYMPKFIGEEDITVEEHPVAFYRYADNLNIENEDVWMRFFVQSLYGEARNWFRGLNPRSIVGIEDLDNAFLRHWGDKKYFLYYITEFGSLKKKEGKFISNFSKIFNKMYNKIPTKIKPIETSSKITYASDFDPKF